MQGLNFTWCCLINYGVDMMLMHYLNFTKCAIILWMVLYAMFNNYKTHNML